MSGLYRWGAAQRARSQEVRDIMAGPDRAPGEVETVVEIITDGARALDARLVAERVIAALDAVRGRSRDDTDPIRVPCDRCGQTLLERRWVLVCPACGNEAGRSRDDAAAEGVPDGTYGGARPPADESRVVVLLTQGRAHGPSVYRRHLADRTVTRCGIELAGVTIPDPPDMGDPSACRTCFPRGTVQP